MKKTYLDEKDFHRLSSELCAKIISIKDKFDWVVGIERGGVPISGWLAYTLGKKHTTVCISIYGDDHKINQDRVNKLDGNINWAGGDLRNTFSPIVVKQPFLIVDDIVDTGTTIKYLKKCMQFDNPIYWVASLHWCPENSPDCKPDFYVETKKKDDWIVYPWEKKYEENSKTQIDKTHERVQF